MSRLSAHSSGRACGAMITEIALLALLGAAIAHGYEIGRCVEVIDGDTLVIEHSDDEVTVSLWGIDAPELGQRWGDEARDNLRRRVLDRNVDVEAVGLNGDEVVARVTVDDEDLSRFLIEDGFAWLAESGDTSEGYALALIMARADGAGMWTEPENELEHPAKWREAHRPRPAPPPTPTPLPSTLSDIADRINIAGDDGLVLTVSDIPTEKVRKREVEALRRALSGTRWLRQKLREERTKQRRSCDDDAEVTPRGEGSYWSEEERRWVQGPVDRGADACARLKASIDDLESDLRERKRAAIDRARSFGIRQSVINGLVARYEVEEY